MHREPRVRFFNPEKARLAQVGTNFLSANVLPPLPALAGIEDSSHSANSRVQKDEGNGQAVVTVVQSEEAGAPFIVLDTELSLNDITLDTQTVSAKLDLLHTTVIEIFEARISDQTALGRLHGRAVQRSTGSSTTAASTC